MNFTGNVILNIYSILILAIILYQLRTDDQLVSSTYRIYLALVRVTIFILIIDITSRFDGNFGVVYVMINHISNFLVFSSNLLIPSLWLLYIHYHIYPEFSKNKILFHHLVAINTLNLIFLIMSYPFGWLYYIDANNIYHRGSFYIVGIIITIVLVISAFIVIYINKKKIEKKHYFALQFFAIPPLVGMILQTLFYDVPIALNSIVLSIFLVFINIQKNTINTDYLTGVGNRNRFEVELANKIQKANKERTFAGIMIDMDDFKLINDIYGHNMGDQALIDLTEILINNTRYNDVIARVGGDEFCIILDVATEDKLDLVIDRIRDSTNLFNETSGNPYKLKFSMGYDIYDYKAKMTTEEFKKHIDTLMYKNKEVKDNFGSTPPILE